MATVTIWSDIHCPWAFVAVHRIRVARDRYRPGVVIDQRPWPLEWINGQGTPRHIVEPETAVLANHEPELFSAFRGESWPSSFLPAFELVAAAREVGGLRAAEDVDYALRLAFFRDSADVSIRAGLEQALALVAEVGAASGEALDLDAVLARWDDGAVRATVRTDYEHSRTLPIQGSPQVFWPDGSTTHNPGMSDHTWLRGIPRIRSSDPEEPARLLQATTSEVAEH